MRTRLKFREAADDDVAAITTLIAHLGYPVREEPLRRTLERVRQTPVGRSSTRSRAGAFPSRAVSGSTGSRSCATPRRGCVAW